jgi:transcriptional regulator with XRE-family HTH domain
MNRGEIMAGGRPSKYESHVQPKLLLVEAWARNGLTDEDICKNLGVSIAAFSNYKLGYLELKEALKRNKEVADTIVENSLYKRALGYTYEEVTRELVKAQGKDGPIIEEDEYGNLRFKEELKITKVVTKEVVADTTAQIFWLKNRNPAAWRDKQDIEHSGNIDYVVKLPSPPV